MRLLLLEDDADMRAHVAEVLRGAGHVIDTAADGATALTLGTKGNHDVLVLDRLVPAFDGLAVLRGLRSRGVTAPALFLTALGEIADRVEGLDAGADDYLVKPFARAELLARVNALGRRCAATTRLSVADLELDLIARSVIRAGRAIELQTQEYRLLEYLVRQAGEVVTRAMLLEHIWNFHFDPGTNMIDSHISRLRAKVDRGFDRELIHTVRGVGYRIDARD